MDITLVPGFNPGPYTGAGNNTYVISGEIPTLLDAATGEAAHLTALAGVLGSSSLAQVLVTHAHPDHVDGCDPIAERWPDAVFRKLPWPEQDRLQSVECVPIADEDRVAAGDGVLRVVHTPGHAPDHLCFLEENTGTLFSADLVVAGSSVVIPASRGGSLAQYLASLRRVLALGPARMLPAHGRAIDDPAAILNQYLEHRQLREDQIVAALRAGDRLPDAIVDRLYEGLDPRLKRMALESVVAHLMKLREEGRTRSDSEQTEWELA
ncbi:MAG: MBL fold metallo-hydrolase [Vicinamibacterales bacterium]|nr:MBL fold metallo-hydrolase [Vicinamibacterales bacterium]MDP7479144.1 MBL fold metallo-hydrolase [Vicinamibacterales bacterium]MDP7691061.1 MBL fold metallo-hydrolase [Vicinamibacterales bacterium]HJN44436.1 MBL fold metallo-hydrolase [Vicinamibacterales bacterium]